MSAGTAPADLASNRRVDIVALSDQPESVRALMPEVLEKGLQLP
jgi:chemotaxis protein MotB